ncbi:hypothetical protein [Streptomyces sp. NPDC051310]|uniref:hypothetical protein n=1 Tax=Streptomyces sp. NPDC051310 TaxID=3365649 RepID=UPI0037AD0E6C
MTEHCITEHKDPVPLRQWEIEAGLQICQPCVNQIRHWLNQIPAALIVLREGSMQRERTGSAGRVTCKNTSAPIPPREEVLNFLGPAATLDIRDPNGDQEGRRPLIGVLGDWCRVILEEHPRRHSRDFKRPAAWTEAALAAWLVRRTSWAATQGWAGEMHAELKSMAMFIHGIARVKERTRPISRPCPRCSSLCLTKTDHDLYNRCSECGGCWTDNELNDDASRRSAA